MRLRIPLTIAAVLTLAGACTTASSPDLAGMSLSDEPLTGKVIWNDLVTEDLDTARRFYGGLFDWTFEDSQTATGNDYLIARQGNTYVAGILAVAPRADGQKIDRWLPYISTDDVDAAIARSRSAGATVAVDTHEVNLGKVAAIIDPEGAVVGLANSSIGDPDDRATSPAPGRVVWSELISADPVAAAAFYRVLAGFDIETISRRGGLYTFLVNSGARRAGILERPDAQIDPVWLTYFGVSDPARAAARARELGGSVLIAPSADVREGSMAVITDPAGAILVLQKTPM
jgi:predicted enzyme related to lactoylglutathione lyase